MKASAIIAFAAVLCLLAGSFPGIGNEASGKTSASTAGCVVLLHGLARSSGSMQTLAEALDEAGYRVVNVDYPSTEKPVEDLAMSAVSEGIAQCRRIDAAPVHFVTHSMGGLLVRYYLTRKEIPELGRTVMLSPPNRGSELADRLRDTPVYQWVNGPAGQQLGTGKDGIASRLPPVDYPVGIITGHEPSFFDAVFSEMIPGEDDGKVSVERAKVEGMADFLSLPYGHTFIMGENEVIGQVLYFLKNGSFQKGEAGQQAVGSRK